MKIQMISLLGPGGDDAAQSEQRDEQRVLADRGPRQLVSTAHDDGDDRRTDSVEDRLDPGEPAEAHVEPGDRQHHRKGRTDERHRNCGRAGDASAHPAEIHRELRCERSRRELRKRQPFEVVLLRDPAAILDQVALHVTGERDRAAESERAEAEEVEEQIAHRARNQLLRGQPIGRHLTKL